MSFWECSNMVCRVLNNCRTNIRFVISENFNAIENYTKFRGEISMWYCWKELVLGNCSKAKIVIVLCGKVEK